MFDKVRYRYVYNRKNRLNAQGRALIQLECRLRQQRIYLSTNVYLLPTEWDGNYVVNSPLASELNAYLAEQLIAIQRIELSFVLRGKSPSLAMLREAIVRHLISADTCYGVTETHKAAISSLQTIEAVDSYDFTAGYQEKLVFTNSKMLGVNLKNR